MINNSLIFDSIDEVQLYLMENLLSKGEDVFTRGQRTLELCNVNFCLTNPRKRITNNITRKWKLPIAIGEFAWHVSGSNDLDFITYYARQWKEMSSDGKLISQSCYGHKIFCKDISGESQWERLIKLLRMDSYSRRAVLDLYDSEQGIDYFSKDNACVCTVQFLIRNGKLDVIVNMRSNDIIWGLPYDIYLFTMLQELLSLQLNVEIGKYYHNVGSMHIYERHFTLGKKIVNDSYLTVNAIEPKMEEHTHLIEFIKYEKIIRTNDSVTENDIALLPIHSYWKTLLFHLVKYKDEKKMKLNKSVS